MNKPPVTLRKIPLEGFIDVLMTLYNKGANFIDIMGTPDEVQDMMSIFVRTEYIDEEHNGFAGDEFIPDEQGNPNVVERKLSDNDLNDLIL